MDQQQQQTGARASNPSQSGVKPGGIAKSTHYYYYKESQKQFTGPTVTAQAAPALNSDSQNRNNNVSLHISTSNVLNRTPPPSLSSAIPSPNTTGGGAASFSPPPLPVQTASSSSFLPSLSQGIVPIDSMLSVPPFSASPVPVESIGRAVPRKRKPDQHDSDDELAASALKEQREARNVRNRPSILGRPNGENEKDTVEMDAPMTDPSKDQPTNQGASVDSANPSAAVEDASMVVIYAPGGTLPRLERYQEQLIEIRVPAKFLTNKNREVQTMQLWGSDIYTDDSDAAAILCHMGVLVLKSSPPTNCAGYSAFFRVVPGQEGYASTARFNYRSRPWASMYSRCSLQFVKADKQEDVALFRTDVESGAPAGKADVKNNNRTRSDVSISGRTRRGAQRVHVMTYVEKPPVKAPGPRSRRRLMPDVIVMFNSLNEPVLKYNLGLVMDRSVDKDEWTSSRLRKECMYFESDTHMYELSREDSDVAISEQKYDRYRWSVVRRHTLPLPTAKGTIKQIKMRDDKSSVVPLLSDHVDVMASSLDWQDIEWAPSHVIIKGMAYPVETLQFKTRTIPTHV